MSRSVLVCFTLDARISLNLVVLIYARSEQMNKCSKISSSFILQRILMMIVIQRLHDIQQNAIQLTWTWRRQPNCPIRNHSTQNGCFLLANVTSICYQVYGLSSPWSNFHQNENKLNLLVYSQFQMPSAYIDWLVDIMFLLMLSLWPSSFCRLLFVGGVAVAVVFVVIIVETFEWSEILWGITAINEWQNMFLV